MAGVTRRAPSCCSLAQRTPGSRVVDKPRLEKQATNRRLEPSAANPLFVLFETS
jgi:hypothetical protein